MKPDVVFEPTPQDVIERMLDLAGVQPGEVLYDLGCGDGRILLAALRRGAIVRGLDCDPVRVAEAKARLQDSGLSGWSIDEGNLFDVDLAAADVVTAFLLPELNDRLKPQLARMRPGARFVSHLFGLSGVAPDRQHIVHCQPLADGSRLAVTDRPIYLWSAPIDSPRAPRPYRLTIGMATFRDFYGVDSTLTELRIYHPEAMADVQLIVVDNEPDGPHGQEVRNGLKWIPNGVYIPFTDVVGTAAPRDLIFRRAAGETVLCIDCHVTIYPGALRRLIDWFEARPGCRDLVTGPIMYDSLASWNTHFNDRWRGNMWGIWSSAWCCPCGAPFSVFDGPPSIPAPGVTREGGDVNYCTLAPPQAEIAACPSCAKSLPRLNWAGHETALEAAGYRRLAAGPDEPEIEVPSFGLGAFACRRDAWPGFNPNFRGFGGEEGYIHEKFRRAGGRCLNLPFLRWRHRYGNPNRPAYPHTVWQMYRNYVIGHAELGLPLERIRAGMTSPIPEAEWAQLVANPHNPPEWPTGEGRGASSEGRAEKPPAVVAAAPCGNCQPAQTPGPAIDVARWFDEHPAYKRAAEILGGRAAPELLFVEHCRTAPELGLLLMHEAAKSRRFVAVYGTHDAELMGALSNWNNHNREWKGVLQLAGDESDPAGLTVLSRLPADWPEEPVPIYRLGDGPGTELKAILKSLGIQPTSACTCNWRADIMDHWGPAGCRANREKIAGWLREGAGEWGWKDKLAAAARAVATGLAFSISWTDPYPSLIDEACRRIEAKAASEAA